MFAFRLLLLLYLMLGALHGKLDLPQLFHLVGKGPVLLTKVNTLRL